MNSSSGKKGAFRRVLDAVDLSRRILVNLVFVILLVFVLVAVFSRHELKLPAQAGLVIAPQGRLVEEFTDPVGNARRKLQGIPVPPETRTRDVLRAIHRAQDDDHIKTLVLDLDDFQGGGLSQLQTIGDALRTFRASGKKIVATGTSYSQAQYYLAAYANTIFLHRQGMVVIDGFAAYQNYFKDALDSLLVDWNVFRIGKYKSFVEPFTRNDMSPAAREANTAVLDTLWNSYRHDITSARGLPPDAINNYVATLSSDGLQNRDLAKLALDDGLVDKLGGAEAVGKLVADAVGLDLSTHKFNQISMKDYLAYLKLHTPPVTGPRIGIVVAEGDIVGGKAPQGAIGSDSMVRLIRKARFDKSVKAVVLRVDSPGGSALAADQILREIELTQQAGKPVVVSMGNVAASGGYWISMAADRIFARPTTITGSIGILGMFPTFQRSLARIGVHTDGLGTTPLAGSLRIDRAMSPALKRIFEANIRSGYKDFITQVAKYRHMSVDAVDNIGQGRVWSGADAKRIGLVDELGGLKDAIASAAKLANISGGYSVTYISKPLSLSDKLVVDMAKDDNSAIAPSGDLLGSAYGRLLGRIDGSLRTLAHFNDPRGVYAYCTCAVR